MEGEHLLLAQLLYGTGMRITEGLQLRKPKVKSCLCPLLDKKQSLAPRPNSNLLSTSCKFCG
jgi:hypothetical protein